VERDIASADLVAELRARGAQVRHAPDHQSFADSVASEAKEGDTILVVGARDPSLPALARRCLDALRRTDQSRAGSS
jgi:UDP-N-acetylmuramate--alanine ligase